MKASIIIILTILTTYFIDNIKAQDILFNQFMYAPMQINPALAGDYDWGDYRFSFNSGNNLHSSTFNSFYTSSISAEYKSKRNIGFGVQAYRDIAGDSEFGTSEFSATIAPIVKISRKNSISIGISPNMSQISLNTENLTWGSQYNGEELDIDIASGEQNVSSVIDLDFSTGFVFQRKMNRLESFRIGSSVYHLARTNLVSGNLTNNRPLRWTVFTDYDYFYPESNISLHPSFLFVQQGKYEEYVLGSTVKYGFDAANMNPFDKTYTYIKAGAFYQFDKTLLLLFGMEFRKQFAFNVSYNLSLIDITSKINNFNIFEISAQYYLKIWQQKNKCIREIL